MDLNRDSSVEAQSAIYSDEKTALPEALLLRKGSPLSPEDDQKEYIETYEKSFGRTHKESLLTGILNLASTHLGPGLLALPYIVRLCGVFGGTLFVFSGGLINVLSKRMLAYSTDRLQISDYNQLISGILGKRFVYWFDICKIAFNLGLLCIYHSLSNRELYEERVSYFAIGGQFFQDMVLGAGEKFESSWIALLQILGFATLILPLCFLKSIQPLKYASILRVVVYGLILLFLFLESSSYGDYSWSKRKPDWHESYNWGVFKTIGTVMFAFSCQLTLFTPRPNVISIESPEKARKAINWTYLGIAIYSYFLAMFGYIPLVDYTEPMIISRKPLPNAPYDLMNLARFGMILVLYVSIPMSVFHCKTSILSAFKKNTTEENAENQTSPAMSNVISVGILYVTALLGFAITSVDNVMALLGAIFCGSLLLFYPMNIYDKIRSQDPAKKKPGWCRMFIVRWMYVKFTIIGFISAIFITLQIFGVIGCQKGFNC